MKNKEVKKTEESFSLKGNFSDLGLKESLVKALDKLDLKQPTPIQRKAIPAALNGGDLIGIAQTGTGKTLAFALPMLQKISAEKGQGLVVTPTRELAYQVAESFKEIGKSFGLRVAILIGGERIDKQLYALRKKPHVVVATPGRLIDHTYRKSINLKNFKSLVLDEADMMFDLGFAPQIEEILLKLPEEKQTMLFSATMPKAIADLANRHLKLPISIEVSPQGTSAENVEQKVLVIPGSDRYKYLSGLIKDQEGSILIFVRTKHGASKLNQKLIEEGYKSEEIHSNLSLIRRKRALSNFKEKKVKILVATDVAARGLDINGIELVVNYNLPDCDSDYVHRIGRTGRAGKRGKAVSIATADQFRNIQGIEKLINKKIDIEEHVSLDKQGGGNFRKRGGGRSRGGNNNSSRGRGRGRSGRGNGSSGGKKFENKRDDSRKNNNDNRKRSDRFKKEDGFKREDKKGDRRDGGRENTRRNEDKYTRIKDFDFGGIGDDQKKQVRRTGKVRFEKKSFNRGESVSKRGDGNSRNRDDRRKGKSSGSFNSFKKEGSDGRKKEYGSDRKDDGGRKFGNKKRSYRKDENNKSEKRFEKNDRKSNFNGRKKKNSGFDKRKSDNKSVRKYKSKK